MRIRLTIAVLLLATLACGFVDDIRSTTKTVDGAVKLLQDLDQNGTWGYVSDGLDQLKQQDQGYLATVRLQQGPIGDTGDFKLPLDEDITLTFQVDRQNNALVDMKQNGQTSQFLIVDGTHVYSVTNAGYTCVNDASDALIHEGVRSAFTEYAGEALGVQLLSVVKEIDEMDVIERETTHYGLESKVPDALEILDKIDNADLRAKLDQAGNFELSGGLYIDKDTGALLRYNSVYVAQDRMEFFFDVTQWGDVPDIALPTSDQIVQACADS